jgi:hypothetical protein
MKGFSENAGDRAFHSTAGRASMSDREIACVWAGIIGGILTAVAGYFCGWPGTGGLGIAAAIASFAYGMLRDAKAERDWDTERRLEQRDAHYRAQQARSPLVVILARPLPAPVVVIATPAPPLPRPIRFDTPEQMEARFLAFLAKAAAAEKPVIRPAARKPVVRTVRVTRTTVTITSQERG